MTDQINTSDGSHIMSNDISNDSGGPPPPSVALIGCGSSGMFFLHSLATRIRDIESSGGDHIDELLSKLPLVTCYEMTDGPGGIWRLNRAEIAGKHNTNMYDTLWSNTPKELTEFADYTYEEHFDGKQTPAFLPRQDVLQYILKRTTSVDAGLFRSSNNACVGTTDNRRHRMRRHQIRYNTTVQNVVYNKMTKKFEITSCDTEWESGDTNSEAASASASAAAKPVVMDQFDYCIWAAGRHGKPRIPRPLLNLLRSGVAPCDYEDHDSVATPKSMDDQEEESRVPFKGSILHSSHMNGFEDLVKDKRVVLVGDSSSAEDLALKAVRDGANMVYILSRSGYGDTMDCGSWPGTINPKGKLKPKIRVFFALPYQVVNSGTGLRCCEISWNQEDEIYEVDEDEEPFTLENIDTIVFCTGYSPNLECLDASLRFSDPEDCFWTAPEKFQMSRNDFSDDISNDIVPSKELDLSSSVIPGVCRNALIANPKMMFLADCDPEARLLELDVAAWLCMAQITGETPTPSRSEMEKEVQEQLLEEMNYPYLRWEMDMNYFDALNDLPHDHWSEDWEDIRSKEIIQKQAEYRSRALARVMRLANYPVDFGTFDELNGNGKKYTDLYLANYYSRISLDCTCKEAEWKTFRDSGPAQFKSMFTGQEACPLPEHWLDLEKDGNPISFGSSCCESNKIDQEIQSLAALPLEPSERSARLKAPTVALIGCGPSGMFFLHALASRRKKLTDSNDTEGLEMLPRVSCFEAADRPGGIWRPQNHSIDEARRPHIYDDCWSNKPKELIEFADYTFEEHFRGIETPVYLPKDDVFDYITERMQTVDPDLFGSVLFNTPVTSVAFNPATEKFDVLYKSNEGTVIKKQFDYCIWAGGPHAHPRIPRQLLRLLRTGKSLASDASSDEDEGANAENSPFTGTILHSGHKSEFEAAVRNKKVVLIGDSESAEDSALHAVKLGATSVHILSRSGYGICKETGSWPSSRNPESGEASTVHVHVALPYRVTGNGTGLKCAAIEWDQEDEIWERDEESPPIELNNVDTIIFCTGYMPNQECLSRDLQLKDWDDVWEENFWIAPSDFQMRPNALSSEIGDIKPSRELDFSGNITPGVYRNVLIANPKMMFILSMDNTLLELDIAAWQCLAYLSGDALVPSKEVMERDIQKQMLREMHIPYLRWEIDMNYFEALDELPDDHWSEDCKDSRTRVIAEEHARYLTMLLAENMRSAKYLVDFGDFNALNEKGEQFVQIELQNDYARSMLDSGAPEAEWKTYRDVDPEKFKSIHTGQFAAALPCRWIDLDKDGTSKTRFGRRRKDAV